jgi:hypothetical protein
LLRGLESSVIIKIRRFDFTTEDESKYKMNICVILLDYSYLSSKNNCKNF